MQRPFRPSTKSGKARPSFFWQGLLLVLPVLVLAVVGLISLHQDEQAAEQTARKQAAESAASLAQAVRITASDQLMEYHDLQSDWTHGLMTTRVGATNFPDPELTAKIDNWEKTYPGLDLRNLALYDPTFRSNGQLVLPPDYLAPPKPPKWFVEMTAGQRETWEPLHSELCRSDTSSNLPAIWAAFLASKPSADALSAASNYAALNDPAGQIALVRRNMDFQIHSNGQTEAGLPFANLACLRMLERVGSNGWSDVILDDFFEIFDWRTAFYTQSPVSLITPILFDQAAKNPPSEPRQRASWRRLDALWRETCQTRQLVSSLCRYPDLLKNNAWVGNPGQEALAIPLDTSELEGFIPNVWLVPRPVVESVFRRALAENGFLVPDYAFPKITVEGELVTTAESPTNHTATTPLTVVTQSLGKKSYFPRLIVFSVTFQLVSREKMLATVRGRARLFGWLIAGAVGAALAGMIAARRAFYQQHRLSEMKSNFVSSVSHELRAPIASMRLLAEGLERGKISEPAKKQEYDRFLVQESRRLTSLIENVLDFSRIEQGRKEYQFELSDLDAVVDQTVQLMLPAAVEKHVELVWQPGAGPLVPCDALAIQQALINLIDNAIKHSPSGATVTIGEDRLALTPETGESRHDCSPSPPQDCGGEGRGEEARLNTASQRTNHQSGAAPPHPNPLLHKCVEEREPEPGAFHEFNAQKKRGGLGPASNRLHLWVEDQGPGIPAEEHEKIFERFYRRGSELRRETQGIGIGLTIVKHIVEAHGGRVLVRSAPGEGSRFTIELPASSLPETDPATSPRRPTKA